MSDTLAALMAQIDALAGAVHDGRDADCIALRIALQIDLSAALAQPDAQPVGWAVEFGAVSLPHGHPSRITCMSFYKTEAEAMVAASAMEFDNTVLRLYAGAAPKADAQPVAQSGEWEGAEEWMPLAWELCAEECGEEACTELVWEGGPVPEPWGDRWLKYEDEAKRLIALVRKCAPAAAPAAQPAAQDAAVRVPLTEPRIAAPAHVAEVTRDGMLWNNVVPDRLPIGTKLFTAANAEEALARRLAPFTPAHRRRLWNNSPEHQADARSMAGFERIVTLTERAHGALPTAALAATSSAHTEVVRPVNVSLRDIEHELRNLHGVYMAGGARRITPAGLRESVEKNRFNKPLWLASMTRKLPAGSAAYCSCCGEPQREVMHWNLLALCRTCLEVAVSPETSATTAALVEPNTDKGQQ